MGKKVLLTGGAGFIGSHIADALMAHPEVDELVVFDNLSNGSLANIQHLLQSDSFSFVEGDLQDQECLHQLCQGIDLICHQAAMGSVPRSIEQPDLTFANNVQGTFNLFHAAKTAGVQRIVYASSSSVYGDSPSLPKREGDEGSVLSPYAWSKLSNEQMAAQFQAHYGMDCVGLRYFNVFGPRQRPDGPYAAVIPLFISAATQGQSPTIHGDGSQSRDFTYVSNAVHANLQALFHPTSLGAPAYNVACGTAVDLVQLWKAVQDICGIQLDAQHGPSRPGDVKHSQADISKISRQLNYQVQEHWQSGLTKTIQAHE